MQTIRLLVCDLDGTLLNDEGRITSHTAAVLLRARQAGYLVCFASGRHEQMMSIYCDAVGGPDYSISDNGAMARYCPNGEILRQCFVPREAAVRVLAHMRQMGMEYVQYTPETIYYDANSGRLEERFTNYEALSRRLGYPKVLTKRSVRAPAEGEDTRVLKLVAYEEDREKTDALKAFVEALPEIRHEATGYGLTGVFAAGVSKQSALEAIMAHADVTREQVCAFGDYDNDLSLFACAGRRVAVANAVPALMEKATCITASNNEDGVAQYIEKYLLP